MHRPEFLSARAQRADADTALLEALPARTMPPVFVSGLHRSGTTFLYQLLADHVDLAVTRLWHITHYGQALAAQQEGRVDTIRAEVQAELDRRGLRDRGIDGFPVSPDGLEEYAFILRKRSRAWGLAPGSEGVFDAMLKKLAALQPDKPALLLKNPLDHPHLDRLAARYPDARFVLIRRDPVRVLNSQFRNSFLYRRCPEPFLDLLLAGIPLWRFNFKLMTALNALIPDAVYQRLLVSGLRRSIARQLAQHYEGLERVDPARCFELDYDRLVADPAPLMRELAQFLGLPLRPAPEAIAPSPRLEPLLPAVAAVADDFRRQLGALPDARLVSSLDLAPTAPLPEAIPR